MDIHPPAKQRHALLKLAEALDCRDNALRRDECGDWRISGKLGHIYAVPGTLDRPNAKEPPLGSKAWSYCKKALKPFCDVTNDGGDEGMLFLDRLPTPEEAEIIRDKLGVAKKREMSDAELERLKSMGRRFKRRPSDVVGEEAAAGAAPDDSDGLR
jgi:hypothetical protein